MISSSIGIIDEKRFFEALQKARREVEVSASDLIPTLTLEAWLRHLAVRGVLATPLSARQKGYSSSLGGRATESKSLVG